MPKTKTTNQIITTNYLKDFMHSESTSKGKYTEQKYLKDQSQNNSSMPKKPSFQPSEKISNLTNLNYNHMQNIQNKMATPVNNSIRNFDSSKNFSTKNINGKKIVFNEKENVNKFEGMYRQLNNQASNNNLIGLNNYSNNNVVGSSNNNNNINEKSVNYSKFNKVVRDVNSAQTRNDSNKVRSSYGNRNYEK